VLLPDPDLGIIDGPGLHLVPEVELVPVSDVDLLIRRERPDIVVPVELVLDQDEPVDDLRVLLVALGRDALFPVNVPNPVDPEGLGSFRLGIEDDLLALLVGPDMGRRGVLLEAGGDGLAKLLDILDLLDRSRIPLVGPGLQCRGDDELVVNSSAGTYAILCGCSLVPVTLKNSPSPLPTRRSSNEK
jgi:hypothetical protein